MGVYSFNGREIKSAWTEAFSPSFGATNPNNAAVVGGMTTFTAYRTVPWLYRAVLLRCNAVSRFPFALMHGDQDVTDDQAYASLLAGIRLNLWKTEASKILTGRAYWYKAANAQGRNVTPQFLLPLAVTPQATRQLDYFYYSNYNHPEIPNRIELDRMVWFWNPNIESDILPGVADAEVALAAASMLHALDTFTAQFFNQGAVKVTVFPVPQGTQDAEISKFENFLNRRLAGVKNALRNVVMRLNDKLVPIVIGSDIKDTQAVELTDTQRDNVAAALGVPGSVIDGRSSDVSNSRSEELAFLLNTVIPEVELIFERANEQLFNQFELELVAKPDELELMQSAQLEQVTAVMALTGGKPVLLEHEGRALLGYPPVEQAEKLYDEELAELGLTRKADAAPVAPVDPNAPMPAVDAPDSDAMPSMDDAAPMEADGEQVKKALGEWRRDALEIVKKGGAIIGITKDNPHILAVGAELGKAIANDLTRADCVTPAAVRAVFARNWPKSTPAAEPTLGEVMAELRLARLAAEKVAA